MKNLFSPFLAVLLLLLAAGCEDGLGIVGSGFFGSNLTIQATFENVDEPASKTTLHSDGHVYWTPGDAISLFYGSGENGGSRFVSDLTADDRVSSFSGNISAVTGVSESSADQLMFWGLYPYDPESSCDGQTVTTTIRSVQEGMADTFAPGFAPSLGRAPGLLISFRNIFSGLYFTVTEPGYLSMTLRSNNGEPISGRAKIGFDSNGYPEVREILEGSSSVSVTAPTSEGFEVGKKYYVLFYPQTLTGGFTMELRSASQKGTFTVGANVPFERNKISNVVRLNEKSSFVPIGTEQGDNELWYTSSDGSVVKPNDGAVFNAGLIMNTYFNGKGVMVFDGPLTTIDRYAFGNTGMTSVSFPSTVTYIGEAAFEQTGLTTVTLPESLVKIGEVAFAYTPLETVVWNDNLKEIGEAAFMNTGLTSVSIPASFEKIGEMVFSSCASLTEVTIAEGVTSIPDGAFYKSGLTSITLPGTMLKIGEMAFAYTPLKTVVWNDNLKEIGEAAFMNTGLTSVNIPAGLEKIGEMVFSNCASLTEVTIAEGVTSIPDGAFYGSGLTGITLPGSMLKIGEMAFAETPLSSVVFNDNLKEIGDGAFMSTALTGVSLPAGLETIGQMVFYRCPYLTTAVSFAVNPPSSGEEPFRECGALSAICVPAASVASYKAAAGWSAYADKIVAIKEGNTEQIAGNDKPDILW